MPPSKLSDSDKRDILNLYQQPDETTTSLASRYGVSNTTIIRILKSSLLAAEYEALVQQKRSGQVQPHVPATPELLPPALDVAPDEKILEVTASLVPEMRKREQPDPPPAHS
ncbi:hypothetical protein [Neosynechococcus sphagnicola]|uniref:hypothetical protein n=1 Tax=Neosynechococcus sphagnicola TaxID=1501145 RepID=UPI0005651EB1|nr:hypothetical protein [Neosynechococcus sphagnicola]